MLELPNVTLIAMGSTQVEGMVNALQKSSEKIHFGAVKLVSHYCPRIKVGKHNRNISFEYHTKIESIDAWNKAIIYDLRKYIDTSHAILIHADGYIIHPELWRQEWLDLDYIGSPWPLPVDTYSYRSESGKIQRVGNSVSLRSKKLMDLIATKPWKPYYGNTNEDGFICCHNREWLEYQGCKFGSFDQALFFGKEHELIENEGLETFLFHSL